jgi:hypothetical protein
VGQTGTPVGEFYSIFGGPNCASSALTMVTGRIEGCERQRFVSCEVGRDCSDCRRSASWRAGEDGTPTRRLLAEQAALPAAPAEPTLRLPSLRSARRLSAFFAELAAKRPRQLVLPPAYDFWWKRFNHSTAKFAYASQQEFDRALRRR